MIRLWFSVCFSMFVEHLCFLFFLSPSYLNYYVRWVLWWQAWLLVLLLDVSFSLLSSWYLSRYLSQSIIYLILILSTFNFFDVAAILLFFALCGVTFYLAHWEEYFTHSLTLGAIGPVETQVILTFFHIWTFFVGRPWWSNTVIVSYYCYFIYCIFILYFIYFIHFISYFILILFDARRWWGIS